MKDLREEVVTKYYIVGKIVKSRMKWAGHILKRSETNKEEGSRKRGNLQLRLCADRSENGRGGRKVERKGQQQGPMETNYESSRTSERSVDQPHPYTRETRGRTTK